MSIVSVDAGLFILNGRQVRRLLRDDVPIVAKAITCAIRGQARVAVDHVNNVPLVHLSSPEFDIYIRGEDWAKITPKLEDGTLNPIDTAVHPTGLQSVFDSSPVDIVYTSLYRRVQGLLLTLFTESTPIPNL